MKIHVQVPLWNVTYKIERQEDELDPTQDSFPVGVLKALEEALANLGLIFVVFSE